MPIRINFLAEHQAAEELKRRDPVKRARTIGIGIVLCLVLWAAYLQVRLIAANSRVGDVEARFKQIEAQYRLVRTNYAQATDAISKLAALEQLATNRFLWAPPLNALQHVTVQDVQLNVLRGRATYQVTEATPAVTNTTGVISAKPATSREKIVLSIEARDFSTTPGDHIRLFQDAIGNHPYFKTNLSKAEMTGRSPVQPAPVGQGNSRSFVTFMIECQYPEQVR
jgi:hypothetical protein